MSPSNSTNKAPAPKGVVSNTRGGNDLMSLFKVRPHDQQQHGAFSGSTASLTPAEEMARLKDILAEALEILDDEDLF